MAEAQACISSQEFTEWQAYYSLEPFGQEPDDLRAATLAALTANANRDGKKQPRPFTVNDFRLMKTSPKRKTAVELLAAAERANALLGGMDVRDEHTGDAGR